MECLPTPCSPSFSSIQKLMDKQMQTFNTMLLTTSPQPNDEAINEKLEAIQEIIKFSLGFLIGLLNKNQDIADSTTTFGKGETCGAASASGISTFSSMTGAGAAVAGFLTKHTWALYVGGAGAIICATANFTILACATYHAQKDHSKSNAILNKQQIQQALDQAINIQACIEKFANCRQGTLEPLIYQREVTKCLESYRSLLPNNQSTDVYNRMISLFIHNLPEEHEIFKELDTLHLMAIPNELSNLSESAKIDENQEREFNAALSDFSHEDSEEDIVSNKSYQESLKKCHLLIQKTFGLNPKNSLKFIEVPAGTKFKRYTLNGYTTFP